MRVLLTGGAGFIGSNYARGILNKNLPGISSVTVLDKLTYAGVATNVNQMPGQIDFNFVSGDICDYELTLKLIKKVDAVVNFAAESHVDRSIISASEFVRTNVMGVQTLLDAIRETKRQVRFLQVSTDEVYGSITTGSWTEKSPLQPNSPYSASKAGGELLVRSYFKTFDMDVLVTRSSNNYGPYQFPEKLIPLFITNLLEGKKVPVYGNGANVRDWLHVDDHCNALHAVLMRGKPGEIYNIGGGQELTNMEITKMILEALDAEESSIEYVDDRKGHDFRYSVDWSKIKIELGYEPKVNYKNGLIETINWYKNNREWWEPLKHHTGFRIK